MRTNTALTLLVLGACRARGPAPLPSPPSPPPPAPAAANAPPPTAAPPDAGDGLPPPWETKIAVNPARLVARVDGEAPVATGLAVTRWAAEVGEIRTVAQSPSGEVFAADRRGTIVVFADLDGDGAAESRRTFARGLELPFGLAFHPDGWLYVAATSAVWRYRYRPGMRAAEGPPERLFGLPGHGYRQHWTRNLALSGDGATLYVSVGSETNVEPEEDPRAAILRAAADGTGVAVFARGLRNAVGLAVSPAGRVVAAVNERDELGDDLPPDYLTAVPEGAHFGWPYAYWGAHEDPRRRGERPDIVARARRPDLSLGAHAAPISVVFPRHNALGIAPGDAVVSLHGSWNRARHAGYKVVRVPFRDGIPIGPVSDLVTGWLRPDGTAWGRPAGMCELSDGSLLIVDDGDRSIWRVARR